MVASMRNPGRKFALIDAAGLDCVRRGRLQRLDRFRIEEEGHDADEGDAFLVHPGLFVGGARYDDLAEVVSRVGQRKGFLLALGFVGNLPGGLDVDAFRVAIDDKVDLMLPLFANAVLVHGARFDNSDVDGVAPPNQFVVNGVFHQMCRFVLAEVHANVAKSGILGIVLERVVQIVVAPDVESLDLADQEGVAEEVEIFGDGYAVSWEFGNGGDGVGQFGRIGETSEFT